MASLETSANHEAITAWNTILFDKFVRFRHLLTTGLSHHGNEALRRHPPRPGARALDVGCGFGDTTIELAKRLQAPGRASGVDGAERFIELCRQDGLQSGLQNLEFFAADVQAADLRGPYDYAFSRFGTMFFSSPVAALRNVRRALNEDGELVLVVWRKREDNAWLYAAEQCVRSIVPEVEKSDAVTCGPGPFSMAGPDLVSDQLLAANFTNIGFERFDADICIGNDLSEAVEFALALGPAGEILRLAGAEAERYRAPVMAGLRDALSMFVRENGVYAPSSTWIISARPA